MRTQGLALFFGVSVWLLGCSDEPSTNSYGPTADVSGSWCGKKVSAAADCLGDEVEYLELTQAASGAVTGLSCEAFGKDCYDVQSGNYADGRLTYYYTFSSFRVDVDFTSSERDTLTGTFHSNKCGCEVPFVVYRIPSQAR